MAYPKDCFGCSGGVHQMHDPSEGSQPGLIGGTICMCTGDCAVRFKERGRKIVEALQGKGQNYGDPAP